MAKPKKSTRDLSEDQVRILRDEVNAWLREDPKRSITGLAKLLGMEKSGLARLVSGKHGASIGLAHAFADFREIPRSRITGESVPDDAKTAKERVRRSARFKDAPIEVQDIYDATAFARNRGKGEEWWRARLELAYDEVATNERRAALGLEPVGPVPGAIEIEIDDEDEPRNDTKR